MESLEGRQLLSTTTTFLGVTPVLGDETQHLVSFRSGDPGGSETDLGSLTGVASGYTLDGLAVDPANGNLYGVAYSGSNFQFYQVDAQTDSATALGYVHNWDAIGVPPVGFTYSSDGHLYLYETESDPIMGGNTFNWYAFDLDGNNYSGQYVSGPMPIAVAPTATSGVLIGVDGSGHFIESTSPNSWSTVSTLSGFTGEVGQAVAVDSDGNAFLAGPTAGGYKLYSVDGGSGATGDLGILPQSLLAFAPTGTSVASPYFTVAGVPSPDTAGSSQSITVTAYNGDGTVDAGYTGTVHFTSDDAQAGLPADYTFVPGGNGAHTFAVALKTAGVRSITATDAADDMTGSETGIGVVAAPATHFVVAGLSGGGAGSLESVTVTAEDQYGNVDAGYTGTVHFTSTDPLAGLPGDYTFVAGDDGTHTFDVVLKKSGSQSITATDTVANGVTGSESGVAITPGSLSQFGVLGLSGATAGTGQSMIVAAEDQYGNVVTTYGGTVHFTSTDPAAVLPGNSTLTAGVGTFPVTLVTAGTRSVTATDTSDPGITGAQGNLVITAGAATHFALDNLSGGVAGTEQLVAVTAEDPYGNDATSYSGTVHFTSSDPRATLPANTTLFLGYGTFDLTLVTAGTQSVTATDTVQSTIVGTASGLVITPAAPANLVVTGIASGVAGTPETGQITAEDAYGNTTTFSGTVDLASTDPAANLPASTVLVGGVGSFSVTLMTPGTQSVTATSASDPTLTGTQSGIVVTPMIRGVVFSDPTVVGTPVAGSGMAGRFVFLDLHGDGTFDPGDPSTTTAADGSFSFPGYAQGSHPALEVPGRADSDRNAVDVVTTAVDGSVQIGVVPISSVAPVPVLPDPFAPYTIATSDAAYVESLYRSVLGRQGSSGEVAAWTSLMARGTSRWRVAWGFVNSNEHRTDEVTSYYETFLGRAPDPGAQFYIAAMTEGEMTEEQVVESILGSFEFNAGKGDDAFVTALYLDVFGRTPDAAGQASWEAALAGGMSRQEVADDFVNATEAIDQAVDSFYSAYLHRAPDPAGFAFWTGVLSGRRPNASFVEWGFVSGGEYQDLVDAALSI